MWQFCTTLDRCHAHAEGRVNFPFDSELFCLFFERFLEARPSFIRRPHRPNTEARMHMWGQMIPNREETLFPARISDDALELLANVDEHPFILVPCPYARLDWRGCANILFITDEPPDDRGNIIVLFKFILTCSLTCFY